MQLDNLRRLHEAGVTILAGSDTQSGVFPGAGLHRELAHLVRAGLTPVEAPPTPAADPSLERALAALPVEQRAVVVCRYLLDWSEFQTAEALQIAPGTVKSRLSRGLDRLATTMEAPQ